MGRFPLGILAGLLWLVISTLLFPLGEYGLIGGVIRGTIAYLIIFSIYRPHKRNGDKGPVDKEPVKSSLITKQSLTANIAIENKSNERPSKMTASVDQHKDEFFITAWDELENGNIDKALWARVFAETEGDETKAKAHYIDFRVAMLIQAEEEEISKQAEEAKKQKEAEYQNKTDDFQKLFKTDAYKEAHQKASERLKNPQLLEFYALKRGKWGVTDEEIEKEVRTGDLYKECIDNMCFISWSLRGQNISGLYVFMLLLFMIALGWVVASFLIGGN